MNLPSTIPTKLQKLAATGPSLLKSCDDKKGAFFITKEIPVTLTNCKPPRLLLATSTTGLRRSTEKSRKRSISTCMQGTTLLRQHTTPSNSSLSRSSIPTTLQNTETKQPAMTLSSIPTTLQNIVCTKKKRKCVQFLDTSLVRVAYNKQQPLLLEDECELRWYNGADFRKSLIEQQMTLLKAKELYQQITASSNTNRNGDNAPQPTKRQLETHLISTNMTLRGIHIKDNLRPVRSSINGKSKKSVHDYRRSILNEYKRQRLLNIKDNGETLAMLSRTLTDSDRIYAYEVGKADAIEIKEELALNEEDTTFSIIQRQRKRRKVDRLRIYLSKTNQR